MADQTQSINKASSLTGKEKEKTKGHEIVDENKRTNEEGLREKEIEAGRAEKTPKNELTIDEALEVTGSFGRFQIALQLIFTYLIVAMAYQFMMSYFIADDPSWRCTSKENATSLFCRDNHGTEFTKEHVNYTRRCQLQRHEWIYTTDKLYSYVTEFDLVCEETSVSAFASGIYHLGGALGVFISGAAADRYGRKLSLLVCLVMMVCFSIGCSFVTNITQLTFIRFILGAAGWSVYSIVYVYSGEFVTPIWRPLSANILGVGFSVSMLLMDLFAYHVRSWRKLQLFTALPVTIVLVALLALPDSPRWHLVMNEKEKAENTLNAIGRFNRQKKPCVCLKEHHKTVSATGSSTNNTYLDLLRNRKVLAMTLVLGLLWLTAGVSFYMITFESSNLGGDMYESFAFSTVAALPSNFFATYALNRFGRKRFILLCLVLAGALTGATTVIPSSYSAIYTTRIALLSLANFFVFSALLGCYIWTFEIFPTTLRLQGWGICIALERLGSFSAPFLTTVLQQYNSRLPYICVMVLCVSSATAGLTLPDTNKTGTRESFDDFFETRPRVDTTTAASKDSDVTHNYENRGLSEDAV